MRKQGNADLKKMLRQILYLQGFYFMLTGIWPVLSIDSFMFVTGTKTDLWLVKIFGAVLFCEGLCFVITGTLREISFPVVLLAVFNSIILAYVDIYYCLNGVLRDIYLVDAFIEGILISWWMVIMIKLIRSC